MPLPLAVPLALSGISALAGLFGSKNQKQSSNSTSTENFSTSNTPTFDPATEIMKKLLMDKFLGRTEDDSDYFSGFATEGLKNINAGADAADTSIENILASRGLGRTSAGASSRIGNQLNRVNAQSSFLNSIPQMQDTRNRQNLLDAAGFFNVIPTGTSSTGTTSRTGTGTGTDFGNPLGGTFSSLATTLAGLYGSGAFRKNNLGAI